MNVPWYDSAVRGDLVFDLLTQQLAYVVDNHLDTLSRSLLIVTPDNPIEERTWSGIAETRHVDREVVPVYLHRHHAYCTHTRFVSVTYIGWVQDDEQPMMLPVDLTLDNEENLKQLPRLCNTAEGQVYLIAKLPTQPAAPIGSPHV